MIAHQDDAMDDDAVFEGAKGHPIEKRGAEDFVGNEEEASPDGGAVDEVGSSRDNAAMALGI